MKPMNYRHTYVIRNALKLTYGNLGPKTFSGGETPGPHLKCTPIQKSWLRLCIIQFRLWSAG